MDVGRRLLERNDLQAQANRDRLAAAGVRAVNLLSSPGSGKTALLEALARLAAVHATAIADAPRAPLAVAAGVAAAAPRPLRLAALVGDLATELDARRLEAAGLAAVAITTGQACHLDAAMVARGLDALEARGMALESLDLLLIENVGNLVCPAAYDLGEQLRLVLLAVGEGEDKPLKYPATFHGADLVVLSKTDLTEAVAFDRPEALANIAAVAPRAGVLEVSARSGAGLEELLGRLVEGFEAQPLAAARALARDADAHAESLAVAEAFLAAEEGALDEEPRGGAEGSIPATALGGPATKPWWR